MAQAGEQVFIKAFVAPAAIEDLPNAVLNEFARGDIVPIDLAIVLTFEDRMRRRICAIVGDGPDPLWLPSLSSIIWLNQACTNKRRVPRSARRISKKPMPMDQSHQQ